MDPQVIIQSKNLEITPEIESLVNKLASKLFHFDKKLSRVECYLELAGPSGKDRTISKIQMKRDGRDLFVEDRGVELFDAIRKSFDDAKDALINEKDKELDRAR
ncbi:MAG: HPF/RaiA family ribosome-associated protein [Pseudomonadales bacterium]|jgi:ribosome-associated translation inhibitor RaiA|nr:HPF/RaiA family ribosome-associated protein [Pseudomonadales bacterium]